MFSDTGERVLTEDDSLFRSRVLIRPRLRRSDDEPMRSELDSCSGDPVYAMLHDTSSYSAIEYYEVEKTIAEIERGGFRRIALQFPDELLKDAVWLTRELRSRVSMEIRFYILGDTSYGCTCVDEVAAEHINADLIVHFGPANLAPTCRIPVLYVFGRDTLNLEVLISRLKDHKIRISSLNPDRRVLLLYDLRFSHMLNQLRDAFHQEPLLSDSVIPNLVHPPNEVRFPPVLERNQYVDHSEMVLSETLGSHSSDSQNDLTLSSELVDGVLREGSTDLVYPAESSSVRVDSFSVEESHLLSLRGVSPLDSLGYSLPYIRSSEDAESYDIVYLGNFSELVAQAVIVLNKSLWLIFDPQENTLSPVEFDSSRILRQRYYFMHRVLDAQCIGILIGTMAVEYYMEAARSLAKLIEKSGRSAYIFVVGKINVPKLANFPEIDLFVLVASADQSLIDSKDFMKPVVAPYELVIALTQGNSWTGEYIADFRSLLPRIDEYLRSNDQDSQRLQTVESLDMEETDLSLVSGRILLRPGVVAIEMDHATVASEGKHDENSIQALERIPSLEERARSFALQHTKVFADSSAGARFLLGREYQGLDPQLEQDSSLSISQGRSGLPMMYTHEDNNV